MALTPERIREIERSHVYNQTATLVDFARAIETEVRKEYTELIRQMRDALGVATTPLAKDRQEVLRAIAAANARLEGKP